MPSIRRFGLAAVAALLFAAGCMVPIRSAAGQAAQTLSPGQAVLLYGPAGVNFTTPVDPRFNTYSFHSHVAGVAFAGQAGVGSELVLAAPGAELAVVHVKGAFASGVNTVAPSYNQMRLRLTVTSGTINADFPDLDKLLGGGDFEETVAVAIPKGAPASLGISMGGLVPQSFDLRSLRRAGISPAALYRDQTDFETIVDSSAVQSFNVNTSAGAATGHFGLKEAELAYWLTGRTTLAPSPDQAYLGLYFGRTDLQLADGTGLDADPLPGSAVQIVLPDGSTLPTIYVQEPNLFGDLLAGIYCALVPADITSAKIVVNPGTSVQATDSSHNSVTLNFSGPLTTSVTFPPAWTPPPVSGPLTAPVPHHSHGQSSTPVLPLLLLLLLVIAVSAFMVPRWRRRAWVPVRALEWPPRALPPASVALLSGRRLALPPGQPTHDSSAAPLTPPEAAPVLVIRLLGPIEVEGLRKPITRKAVKRLLVCLAVSGGRALSAEELSVGISDNPDRDPKTQSVQSYASMLRSCLPEGTLPDAAQTGGYLLDPSRVVVDLSAITAVADEPIDRPGWVDRARAALELVRDVPLVGGRWEGIEPAARLIAAGIEGLARTLSSHLRSTGDPDGAEWAVSKGLAAVPKSLGLWQDRLDAAADGSGYGLERAWTDAQTELGPDSALLLAHYQQLRRGLGEQPAASV